MSDSEEDQPRGRFSANYSSSEDKAYHTPEEANPLLHELEQQPSTSTVASERTERQIDLLALRSQTPFFRQKLRLRHHHLFGLLHHG